MSLVQRNHIDFTLLITVIALMLLSLGIVYSASASYAQLKYGESERMLSNHALKVMVGMIVLFIGIQFDYRKLKRVTKLVLISAVLLLLLTLIMGGEVKGATRWLRFSGIGLQPSEFAKYALLFHLCTLISIKGEDIKDFKRGYLPLMIWIGIITGLVLIQPNFSMGVIIFSLGLTMLFVGQVKSSHLISTFAVMIPILLIYMLSADYRRARVFAFLGIEKGPVGNSAYQLNQGILAFGNGGIFGVGPGESRQRDFFLPESYSDFVFSIIGEEYGLVGTVFFMILFLIIMYRGFKIAKHANDSLGRNLAIAITTAIIFNALVNAAVTLGIVPTTGLPMPFVSYGGSSMVFSSFAVGILLNISSFTDLHPRAREIPIRGSVNAGEQNTGKVY